MTLGRTSRCKDIATSATRFDDDTQGRYGPRRIQLHGELLVAFKRLAAVVEVDPTARGSDGRHRPDQLEGVYFETVAPGIKNTLTDDVTVFILRNIEIEDFEISTNFTADNSDTDARLEMAIDLLIGDDALLPLLPRSDGRAFGRIRLDRDNRYAERSP